MAGFLYFISGEQRPPSPERIRDWGLTYAIPKGLEHRGTLSNSPSGKPGAVMGDPSCQPPGKTFGYFPEQQTWRKMPRREGRPECWIGYWNDLKPTPEDLERANMQKGPRVKLADGERWQVPIIRSWDDHAEQWVCELPCPLGVNDDGDWITCAPVARYKTLFDLTAPLVDDAAKLTDPDVFRIATAIMAHNYRVDVPELVICGAFSSESVGLICMIATRFNELQAAIAAASKAGESTPVPAAKAAESDEPAADESELVAAGEGSEG